MAPVKNRQRIKLPAPIYIVLGIDLLIVVLYMLGAFS
ncbi:hypothetical protein J2X76_006352 [Neorhizobium sp. 2083]|nr:hypothetical protein [Neorhizobium sp. 2083]MDR6821146.1 hypothetical protein [Neorhizobium sp. 2083]